MTAESNQPKVPAAHRLDDPARLAQCARIRTMIRQVFQDPARQEDWYAKRYHHWTFDPPVELREVEALEEKMGVSLPDEFVYFLTQVSGGGAGPGTRFVVEYCEESVAGVSELLGKILNRDDWMELYGEVGHSYEDEPGVVSLTGMDNCFDAFLIVTGPNRGRVVYLDYNCCNAPMWPKGSPDFLAWYENFFSELLAGYDISPTWKFMWQEPGDEQALMRAFRNTEDRQYQEEVLYSFRKFRELSEDARRFLESVQDPELRECARKALQKFS